MNSLAVARSGGVALLAVIACAASGSLIVTRAASAQGTAPSTPIRVDGRPFFPIGVYRYPAHAVGTDIFKALAERGFNFYLLPATATKEQFDAAQADGIRVMLVVSSLLDLSGAPEQIAVKKKTLTEQIGPDSIAFKHPAVVALEGPDEPLWNTRYRPGQANALPAELATWVRPAEERQVVYSLLKGLRDGYQEVHRLCGERYQIWLNFAPRGDEAELRWFTEQPVVGGYEQDGRTTADVFGTDIYPVPDGNGNNGWIRGRFVKSTAAVGAFTEKLRRAVHPHPFYMVLHGCAMLEWDKEAVKAGRALRRPTFAEQQFMAFDAAVHGASGILYWGADYIDDASLYWRHIGRVNRQLRALAPILAEGTDWHDARPGMQQVHVLGKVHGGEHYVIATNNDPGLTLPGWIGVPGWKGDQAYSLLDGRMVPVVDGVIRDTIGPLSVRAYSDGTSRFGELGLPMPQVLSKRPMRTLFGLPTDLDPFKGKSPDEIAAVLKGAGVDGVVQLPHDAKLVDAMRRVGIKAYAEIGCFSGKGPWATFPGTRPVMASGEPFPDDAGYGGLCVNHNGYRADLLGRIEHLLGEAKWDGLWLDYIRWPGRWEEQQPKLTDVCFCDTCLARFSADRGVHYPNNVATTAQKAAWILANHRDAWTGWKCDRVTDAVAQIRELVKRKLGPDAILGIFGVPMRQADFDGAIRRTFGQDWAALGPYVDVFSPMVYHIYCHRPLGWINEVVTEVSRQSGRTVWPIVQSCSEPTEMTADEFDRTLHEGLKAPSAGIMVFSTSHTIKEGKWDTMCRIYSQARQENP